MLPNVEVHDSYTSDQPVCKSYKCVKVYVHICLVCLLILCDTHLLKEG